MKRYILKRLIQLVPMMFGVSILVFALMFMASGDPAERQLQAQGMVVDKEIIEKKRKEMGLDRPFIIQYLDWLKNAITGDLGISYKDNRPVQKKLNEAFVNTFILAGVTTLVSILIGIPLGIFTAAKHNKFPDYLFRFISFIGSSVPNFLLCILLIYYFCIKKNYFSIIAKNSFEGLFLPVISLSIPFTSRLIRQVRAELLEQLKKDYIVAERIRGVDEKYILFSNALRNALPGIITVVGLSIGTLLGGSVVIETIFRWPGAGKLVMDSVMKRDYPVIQGFVLYIALIYILLNLIIDISYKLLDPRTEL